MVTLGGMFSYELACQLNYKIAAISSVAGAIFQGHQYCEIFHPTAVQMLKRTEDDITHITIKMAGVIFPVLQFLVNVK